jgi:hypothetical protein
MWGWKWGTGCFMLAASLAKKADTATNRDGFNEKKRFS